MFLSFWEHLHKTRRANCADLETCPSKKESFFLCRGRRRRMGKGSKVNQENCLEKEYSSCGWLDEGIPRDCGKLKKKMIYVDTKKFPFLRFELNWKLDVSKIWNMSPAFKNDIDALQTSPSGISHLPLGLNYTGIVVNFWVMLWL